MDKRVTFNKAMGIVFLLCALFILGSSLVLGPSLNTITGIIILLVSILYLVSPAVIYNDSEIQMKNLFGMTMKRYTFATDKVTVNDRKIYTGGKRVSLAAGMLVRSEYDALLKHIEDKQTTDDFNQKKILKSDDEILDSGMIEN